jgi:hypothetical protein
MSTETAGERKDDGEERMAPPVGGRPFRLGQRAEKPQEDLGSPTRT